MHTDIDITPIAAAGLAARYISVWMEPDASNRRQQTEQLWAPDGSQQLLSPPVEIIVRAAEVGFPAPNLEVRGYGQLESRVTRAYDEFVAGGQYAFRAKGGASRLGNVVTVAWDMVTVEGGESVGWGVEVLVLDPDDRIRVDLQIIQP